MSSIASEDELAHEGEKNVLFSFTDGIVGTFVEYAIDNLSQMIVSFS